MPDELDDYLNDLGADDTGTGAAPEFGRGIGVLAPNAPQGRLYMGQALTPQEERGLMRTPPGTRLTPMMPTADQAATMQEQRAASVAAVPGAQTMGDVQSWNRVAATDNPLRKTLSGVSRPDQLTPDQETMQMAAQMGVPMGQAIQAFESQRRFQAQKGYQADLAAGMSAADAMAKWGPLLFAGPKGAGAMPRAATPSAAPNTYRDPRTGDRYYQKGNAWDLIRPPARVPTPMDTITERQPAVPGSAGQPAVPARPASRFFGIPVPFTGTAGSPGVPAVAASPARTITRHVPAGSEAPGPAPVKKPASEGRVRMRNPSGRVGTLPADQVEDAEAAGWTRIQPLARTKAPSELQ